MSGCKVDNYCLVKSIGCGSSSNVVLASHQLTGQKAALKVFKPSRRHEYVAEVAAYNAVVQKNGFLQVLGWAEDAPLIGKQKEVSYIALELAERDLFDEVKQGRLNLDTAKDYFRQVICAVEALHEVGLAHRDIKLENLFLNKNNQVKLGDLAFACELTQMVFPKGTLGYLAPECSDKRLHYAAAADIFSCGVVLFCLVCGHPPFRSASIRDLRYRHFYNKNFDEFWKSHHEEELPKELKRLIEQMLAPAPEARPSVKEILDFDWLKS